MAAHVLLRLAGLGARDEFTARARQSIELVQAGLARYPTGFGQWLVALDYDSSLHQEVVIVGDHDAEDTRELLATARKGYHPHRLILAGQSEGEGPSLLPFKGRSPVNGRASAYVCSGYSCHTPVTEADALAHLLTGSSAGRQ